MDKTRGLATILGAKEEDLRQQMRLAGISLAGEFSGPGEPGDPTGVMFLRQVWLDCQYQNANFINIE